MYFYQCFYTYNKTNDQVLQFSFIFFSIYCLLAPCFGLKVVGGDPAGEKITAALNLYLLGGQNMTPLNDKNMP